MMLHILSNELTFIVGRAFPVRIIRAEGMTRRHVCLFPSCLRKQ